MDALDGSEGMLEKAKGKGIYKNCIHALIGPNPTEGIEKGLNDILVLLRCRFSILICFKCFKK